MDTVVRERLDRFVADINWCNMFPYAEVIHFPICYSDHGGILLKFGERPEQSQNGRLFRFEALWLSNDDCGKVVADVWKAVGNDSVRAKITKVAQSLTSWASKTFGDVKKRIKDAEKRLKMIQGGQLDANLLQRSHEICEELKELRKLEESYWHARARANELRDGDKNTSYFHHKATHRKKRNCIRGLFDD
ncbi:uncharacterized protein LOC125494664 [Beta vulgaris subsp. vulgaris]|uniref:uncharacterized protein LOC125494664 n=1 Tax=Beta vulgaris subsp. vulgaris TaxID=3555 RepID=UPI002036F295|nr:uncharacterized protein LOC125494664 [Beta vulgaris subsp. vulgaris]